MSRLLFVLGAVWALPVTLAGLLVGEVFGRHITSMDHARFYKAGPWLTRHFFTRFGMAAFCWGGAVIFSGNVLPHPTWILHELVHFKQARIFGVFLPLAYGIGSLVALAQGKRAYYDCFLERWAREESGH